MDLKNVIMGGENKTKRRTKRQETKVGKVGKVRKEAKDDKPKIVIK